MRAADLRNVTLRVEGDLIASDLIAHWPTLPGRGAPLYADILTFSGCEGVAVRGEGKIHGQGFRWWLRTLLKQDQDQRPHIMYWFQARRPPASLPSPGPSPLVVGSQTPMSEANQAQIFFGSGKGRNLEGVAAAPVKARLCAW